MLTKMVQKRSEKGTPVRITSRLIVMCSYDAVKPESDDRSTWKQENIGLWVLGNNGDRHSAAFLAIEIPSAICFTADGQGIAAVTNERTLTYWNFAGSCGGFQRSRECVPQLRESDFRHSFSKEICAIALDSIGKHIALVTDKKLYVMELKSGEIIAANDDLVEGNVQSLHFADDQNVMVTIDSVIHFFGIIGV